MLILGTARYRSPQTLIDAIQASRSSMVTVSLRRETQGEGFWRLLRELELDFLPNTAGCRSVDEALSTAEMARELFDTPRVKLELIGDEDTLQPNPIALREAAIALVDRGFEVWPYCTEDLVLGRELLDIGCHCLMPWASPIGSGRGLSNPYALKTLRQRLPDAKLIVDAGLGAPSQACQLMEMGYDGVMVNTAVALADDPVRMAKAFATAVSAGQEAYQSGLMVARDFAEASTPVLGMPLLLNP